MGAATPGVRVLTPDECRTILARNHVGRIAFLDGGSMDIQPVAFVLHGDWLMARSASGGKIAAIERTPYVAFEVDEVRGPFDWVSVVVHGTIYEMSADGNSAARANAEPAVEMPRGAMPPAFPPGQPVPDPEIMYGLRIGWLTGRHATVESGNGRSHALPGAGPSIGWS